VLDLRPFNKVLFPGADFGRGVVERGTILHQNRIELLAPPFVSRQKVEKKLTKANANFHISG
jgi:hypothetical protein